MLPLGILRRAHGVRGEIKLSTEMPERYLSSLTALSVGGKRYEIEKARPVPDGAIVKLKGIDDKTLADSVRGEAFIPDDARPVLDEGEYFLDDVIGAEVAFEDGETLGKVREIVRGAACDVWSVKGETEIMFPVISGLIADMDILSRRVILSRGVFDRVAVYED